MSSVVSFFWSIRDLSPSAKRMRYFRRPSATLFTASEECKSCQNIQLMINKMQPKQEISLLIENTSGKNAKCHVLEIKEVVTVIGYKEVAQMLNITEPNLLPQQKRLLMEFGNRDLKIAQNPLLLYWSLGSGKTIAALSLIFKGLHTSPNLIFIVCPKSVVNHWAATIQQFTPKGGGLCELVVCSYFFFNELSTGLNKSYPISRILDSVILVDEAHTYRNNSQRRQQDMDIFSSVRVLILMTGTPLVRSTDLPWMLQMLRISTMDYEYKVCNCDDDLDEDDIEIVDSESELMLQDDDKITSILRDRKCINYYDPIEASPYDPVSQHSSQHYPTLHRRIEYVPLSLSQVVHILLVLGKLIVGRRTYATAGSNTYCCRTRALCNSVQVKSKHGNLIVISPKVEMILRSIIKHGYQKHAVFSQFLDNGILAVKKKLDEIEKPCVVVTGSMDMKRRTIAIEKYNNTPGMIILFSECAREGLNLMGTDYFHCIEPQWIETLENQAIARVCRFGSHPSGSNVQVILYVSTYPDIESSDFSCEEQDEAAVRVFSRSYLSSSQLKSSGQDRFCKFIQVIQESMEKASEVYTVEQKILNKRECTKIQRDRGLKILRNAGA